LADTPGATHLTLGTPAARRRAHAGATAGVAAAEGARDVS